MHRGRRYPFLLVFACLACACVMACGQQDGLLGPLTSLRAMGPEFLGAAVADERTLVLEFSGPVSGGAVYCVPELGVSSMTSQGDSLRIQFDAALGPGLKYRLDVTVEDGSGNRLSVLLPFRGRNDRMPALRINEIRTEYSKPKVEFIEIVCLSAGNLGGLRVFSAELGTEAPLFEFEPCEVAAGDYLVLHLRSLEPGCVDEYASLSEAAAIEASAQARDFWYAGTTELFRRNDAVALANQDGLILDAVLLAESTATEWKTEALAACAAWFQQQGAWKAAEGGTGALDVSSAVPSSLGTVTRTLCRVADADTETAADWYTTVTSGATPGLPNTAAAYQP